MMLRLMAMLGLDASGYELGIKRAQSVTDKFASSVGGGLKNRIASLFTLAAAEEGIRRIANYAGHIKDLSDRLEISTDAVQQWEGVVTKAGAKAEHVAGFFEKLAEAREKALGGGQGSAEATEAFKKLGVTHADLRSKRLEDIGLQIGNAVKDGDAQLLVASLKEVGGKGASNLIAAFKSGLEEGFKEVSLIPPEKIAELDALGDRFSQIGKELLAEFAPFVAWLGKQVDNIVTLFELVGLTVKKVGMTVRGEEMSLADEAGKIIDAWSKRQQPPEVKDKIGGSDIVAGAGKVKKEKEASREIEPGHMQKGVNANPLQQIGARVAFVPLQSELQRTVQALKENTAALKAKATKPIEGFDGNSVQYGSNV
jgi:hypothetical protein